MIEDRLRTLPKKLRIGAYDHTVVVSYEPSDSFGETDPNKHRITLWPADMVSERQLAGTFLHEILHAIYETEGLLGADEEGTICGFENGLIALFRDNPKLLTWIKKCLKSN